MTFLLVAFAVLMLLLAVGPAHAKGGSSSTTTSRTYSLPTYDPMSATLKDTQGKMTNLSNALASGAKSGNYIDAFKNAGWGELGTMYQDAWNKQNTANKNLDTIGVNIMDLLGQVNKNTELSSKSNDWYDNYARENLTSSKGLLDNGLDLNSDAVKAFMGAINQVTTGDIGDIINRNAASGILNSSTTSGALGNVANQAGNVAAQNYGNLLNMLVGGYQGNAGVAAQDATAFTNNYANLNNGALDAVNANMAQQNYYTQAIPQYWLNAAAPTDQFTKNYERELQNYWTTAKRDNIVETNTTTSGGGK